MAWPMLAQDEKDDPILFDLIASLIGGVIGGAIGGAIGDRRRHKQSAQRTREFKSVREVRVPCALKIQGQP